MTKPTAQQCHAMTTYFVNAYVAKYQMKPVVNRNVARWGFESVLMDYPPTEARELVDFYFKTTGPHDLTWFLYNYDKVEVERQEYEENKRLAKKRMKETEERLRVWRERNGNSRS
jgi:hypothetical protein